MELIELIREDPIEVLVDLYNSIYNTKVVLKEGLKSTFIALPRKINAKEFGDTH